MKARCRHAVGSLGWCWMLDTQQIDRLIASSRSRPGGQYRRLVAGVAILSACFALAVLAMNASGWPAAARLALPWLFLLAIGGLLVWWVARQRQAVERSRLAVEALQLEDWDTAEQQLVARLSRPVNPPSARAQALLALGTLANRQGAYQGAANVFQALADEPAHNILSRTLGRVGLAEACLRLDRLTDAVDLLASLRQLTLPDFIRARLELVALFQEVSMGHGQEAAQAIDERAELFRKHLSTRAGMGYGLFAAACHQQGDPQQAETWWKQATVLVRLPRLLADYPLLAGLAEKYPSVEWPWPVK